MKKIVLAILALFMTVSFAIAEEDYPPPRDRTGVIGNARTHTKWRLGLFQNVDGVKYEIPLAAWKAMKGSAEDNYDDDTFGKNQTYVTLTTSTEPNLYRYISNNGRTSQGEGVQWSDGDGDWLEVWYQPMDIYPNKGAFKFLVGQTDAKNPRSRNYIQYKTTIIRPGQDFRSATEITHGVVVIPYNANEYSPQIVTLSVVSPNAVSPDNIIADSWIRLRYRRYDKDVMPSTDGGDNVGASTGDLHVWKTYWDPSAS